VGLRTALVRAESCLNRFSRTFCRKDDRGAKHQDGGEEITAVRMTTPAYAAYSIIVEKRNLLNFSLP
jgi:hypothetical protein